MPRIARIVFAGIPYHITQRGNRGQNIFFSINDRHKYLESLRKYSAKEGLNILAYCLMTNHIHIIAIPKEETSLQRTLKPLHTQYAVRINRRYKWTGHFWQGRYFSSPLDDGYMWAAIRYVERNPVRAKMVKRAEEYPWSSAAANCGLLQDKVLTQDSKWKKQLNSFGDWYDWLRKGDDNIELEILRRNIDKCLPCGEESFIKKLEKISGRLLHFRPQGRPRKETKKR